MKKVGFPIGWFIGFAVLLLLTFVFKYLTFYECLQILLTFTLVLVTTQYTVSTNKMAVEMELTRKNQNKPYIVAFIDNPRSSLLELVVKNIGYGVAQKVELSITPRLIDYKKRDIGGLSLFKNGISNLPPDRELRQTIGSSSQFFDEKSELPLEYDLTVSYCDFGKNQIKETIHLDLGAYRHLTVHRKSDIEALVKAVQELTKSITQK